MMSTPRITLEGDAADRLLRLHAASAVYASACEAFERIGGDGRDEQRAHNGPLWLAVQEAESELLEIAAYG